MDKEGANVTSDNSIRPSLPQELKTIIPPLQFWLQLALTSQSMEAGVGQNNQKYKNGLTTAVNVTFATFHSELSKK